MSDFVFNIKYDYNALKLEYKTTCDALQRWPGGDGQEQDFLAGSRSRWLYIVARS